MPVSDLSPNVDNYYVGKGIVEVSLDDMVTWRDVGNVPLFEITISVTKLEHYSSRQGLRLKDKSIVTEIKSTFKMTMDEITSDNLVMSLLGTMEDGPPIIVNIGNNAEITCAVRFTGTNQVGTKMRIILPSVLITPSAALSPIGDTWGHIEVDGDVNADIVTGSFGTVETNTTAVAGT